MNCRAAVSVTSGAIRVNKESRIRYADSQAIQAGTKGDRSTGVSRLPSGNSRCRVSAVTDSMTVSLSGAVSGTEKMRDGGDFAR